jgi:phosphoglycolate phosphatase
VGDGDLVCRVSPRERSRILTALSELSLIAFDLDGTLVNSRQDIADSANALLVECGGTALSADQIGKMVGDGAATLVARAFTAAALVAPPDALSRFLALYDDRLLNHTRPYDGIEDLLELLRSRVTLAILTNKPRAATIRILDGLDLSRFFDPALTFGGDGDHLRKPDPAGLLALAALADTSAARTLMVGDSVVDWRTAHAAGAQACVARYGFGFETFPKEELGVDDLVIDSPRDLERLL